MNPRSDSNAQAWRPDSFVWGMLFLLMTTVLQRVLGLVRGVLLCRWLDETSLGTWTLALSVVTMGVPMLLLGIPGSMGRFVEHFRLRGQLRRYLGLTFGLTLMLALLAVGTLLLCPDLIGRTVFREALTPGFAACMAAALMAVVCMNCTAELAGALRQIRLASWVQFIFGFCFTVIGCTWLALGGGVSELLLSYALSAMLACLPAYWIRQGMSAHADHHHQAISVQRMLRRVAPFAASLWAMNLLSNAMDLSNRYCLLSFHAAGTAAGYAALGQFQSSSLLPALLASLATMFSSILLPYMNADLEAGHRRRVVLRCKQALLACSALFTGVAIVGVLLAPWLYGTLLANKYPEGMAILPAMFALSIWSVLALLSQAYLWCNEKGKSISVVLGLTLLLSLALNAWFIPHMGLRGAIVAQMITQLISLLGHWWLLARNRFRLDFSTVWTTVLPGTILLGPTAAIVALAALGFTSSHVRHWVRGFEWRERIPLRYRAVLRLS